MKMTTSTNVPSQPGTTSYPDANALASGRYFALCAWKSAELNTVQIEQKGTKGTKGKRIFVSFVNF